MIIVDSFFYISLFDIISYTTYLYNKAVASPPYCFLPVRRQPPSEATGKFELCFSRPADFWAHRPTACGLRLEHVDIGEKINCRNRGGRAKDLCGMELLH